MSTVIRTDHLPPKQRFAFWREVVSQTWVPTECSTDDESGFAAELRSGELGAVQVNVVTSAPYQVRRTPALINRSDPDMLKLVMPLPGATSSVVISQGRARTRLAPTDFALYDTARPYEARGGARRRRRTPGTLTMMFPRQHISRRHLHKLFQEQGETVAGWIRARRLDACRRDLADPALASRPVAAIAARWGFADAGHFTRVFKAAHGLTPQEYRRHMADGAREPSTAH